MRKIDKAIIFKSIWSIPVLFSLIVSINHCFRWFQISNPPYWAWFISISIEIVALTTLVALILGKNTFSIIATFVVITFIQILGNVFFSFNFIDENGQLFQTWQKFVDIIFSGDWGIDRTKFYLALLQGSIVPLLSLLSLDLIAKFELKENKKEEDGKLKVLTTTNNKEEPIYKQMVGEPYYNSEPITSSSQRESEILPQEPLSTQDNEYDNGIQLEPSVEEVVGKIKKEELSKHNQEKGFLPRIKINKR